MHSSFYRYFKYNLYHHPTIVASFILAIGGPAFFAVGYPIRRELGYKYPVDEPRSYPMPGGPRTKTIGYDD
ncbi:hypothetical protein BJ742DRAFT_133755 [Cladochytrium replicatum]|nr:hypothetical protein BJ742DRAFT_133755 [Cladochytrium replicatum]